MIFFFSLAEKIRPLATNDDSTSEFWLNLHNFKSGDEYPYREITQGVIKMFCLPHSNAEAERDFSAVTYYKSNRRTLMSTELLEAIMYCKFGLEWLGIKDVDQFKLPMEMLNYNASLLYGDTHAYYKEKND